LQITNRVIKGNRIGPGGYSTLAGIIETYPSHEQTNSGPVCHHHKVPFDPGHPSFMEKIGPPGRFGEIPKEMGFEL